MSTASAEIPNEKEEQGTEPPSNGSGDGPKAANDIKYIGITKLRNFLSTRRLELGMLVTRLVCVFFSVFYILPIFGSTTVFLRRALIANALTSSMRLFQRLGGTPISLTKEFIGRLIIEDSCHYLFYSIIFMVFGHISISLIPILLISSLHVANFILQILDVVKGPNAKLSGLGSVLFYLTSKTPWILKLVATTEIALMVVVILNCFRGNVSIIALFMYYRFLYLRYASKRNHYTRIVFYEMRSTCDGLAANACPAPFAWILRTVITTLCKLAPKTNCE